MCLCIYRIIIEVYNDNNNNDSKKNVKDEKDDLT